MVDSTWISVFYPYTSVSWSRHHSLKFLDTNGGFYCTHFSSKRRNPFFFVCLSAKVSHKKISYDAAHPRREMFWFSKRNWNVLKFTVIAYIVWAYFCVERMLHIFTVKLLSSNRNGFLQYISTSLARLFNLRNLWCPQSCAQKLKSVLY